MADNLNELRNKAEQEAVEAENNVAELQKQYSSVLHNLISSGQYTIKEGQDIAKTVKALDEALKSRIKHEKLIQQVIDEATKSQKQLAQEQRKKANELKNPQNFWERVGFTDIKSEEMMATQYRARHATAGINALFNGNISSGLYELFSVSKKFSNFMAGPYFLAIQAAATGLIKLDKAIEKVHQEVLQGTGGVYSPFKNRKLDSVIFKKQLTSDLREFGLQDKSTEILGAALSSTGLSVITNRKTGEIIPELLRQRVKNQGAAMRYMGSLGISEDSINNMFKISRNLEGQSEEQAFATQYRLAQRFKRSRYMTESEGAQQSLALYEQTKSLGVNFEWASETVKKFDKALQLGEVSLNDFAAVTRGLKGSDTGKATGIAAMVRDIAARNGIELPKKFTESSDIGAGLYLQTREGLSNKNIQKALKLLGLQTQSEMNLGPTEYDQARGLQIVLQALFGSGISPDMALQVQKSGNWADILGGKGSSSSKEYDKFMKDASEYYKNSRGWVKTMSDAIGGAADKIVAGFAGVNKDNVSKGEWLLNTFIKALTYNPTTTPFGLGATMLKGQFAIGNGTTEPSQK